MSVASVVEAGVGVGVSFVWMLVHVSLYAY
jgi:hypothetical protein